MASSMESTHLIFGLRLLLLPSVFPSIIVFSKEPSLLMMKQYLILYPLKHLVQCYSENLNKWSNAIMIFLT